MDACSKMPCRLPHGGRSLRARACGGAISSLAGISDERDCRMISVPRRGAGNLLYETVRFDPKTFKATTNRCRTATPAWGLNGSRARTLPSAGPSMLRSLAEDVAHRRSRVRRTRTISQSSAIQPRRMLEAPAGSGPMISSSIFVTPVLLS